MGVLGLEFNLFWGSSGMVEKIDSPFFMSGMLFYIMDLYIQVCQVSLSCYLQFYKNCRPKGYHKSLWMATTMSFSQVDFNFVSFTIEEYCDVMFFMPKSRFFCVYPDSQFWTG